MRASRSLMLLCVGLAACQLALPLAGNTQGHRLCGAVEAAGTLPHETGCCETPCPVEDDSGDCAAGCPLCACCPGVPPAIVTLAVIAIPSFPQRAAIDVVRDTPPAGVATRLYTPPRNISR